MLFLDFTSSLNGAAAAEGPSTFESQPRASQAAVSHAEAAPSMADPSASVFESQPKQSGARAKAGEAMESSDEEDA